MESARMTFTLGGPNDVPLPRDYDGNGAADVVVYRPATGFWYFGPCASTAACQSADLGFVTGDVPVPADYDGDGVAQIAVFRIGFDNDDNDVPPGYWLLGDAGCRDACPSVEVQWGQAADVPLPADYDGDGAAEIAIARPEEGYWYVSTGNCAWESGCEQRVDPFAPGSSDIAVPGDYDGDSSDEMAFFRPSVGGWYIASGECAGTCNVATIVFGLNLGQPVPGDYDGDGITDLAVFQSSTGLWTIRQSSDCSATGCRPTAIIWGENRGEVPVPADYDGDGTTDIAVYRLETGTGTWYVR